jgi:hypothetical protein
MRSRRLGGRVTAAIVAGLIVSIAVGGGYAVASISSAGGKINACSQKKTHLLYTGSCKRGDKKLSWNKRGPQGPGATSRVFNGTGTASPTPTPLGSMGAYTLKASCVQPSPGTTVANLFVTGPAGELDGMTNGGVGGPSEGPDVEPFGPLNIALFGGVSSTGTPTDVVSNWVWLPSSGTAADSAITIVSNGGATNTCHISVFVTPASSSASSGAAIHSGTRVVTGQKARSTSSTVKTIP